MAADNEVEIDLKADSGDAESAFKSLKEKASEMGTAIVDALSIAGDAIISLGETVISSYASYEQLVGGIETLFGAGGRSIEEYAESVGKTTEEVQDQYESLMAAQETVLANADDAYKNAGLSANEYMDTVTGFSASLISSLDGDTELAAQYADMAITDMADNANKMGTAMADIQHAYQGFAKQNYTMLDNLKLGYGGTKEEMERLLEDATALSGIEYDISSYADIVDAIHVIQTDMDITGTTAKEAASTIEGSVNTLKASLTNLATGFGDANADIEQLCDNVAESFKNVVSNITPVIANIISALPTALDALSDAIVNLAPTIISTATQTIEDAVEEYFPEIIDSLLDCAPQLTDAAVELIDSFVNGLNENIHDIAYAAVDIVSSLCEGMLDVLPSLVTTAAELITGLADGLIDNIPTLIPAAVSAIQQIVDGLSDNLPKIVDAAVQIVDELGKALGENTAQLISAAVQIVTTLEGSIHEALPELAKAAVDICKSIADSLVHFDWATMASDMMNNIVDAIEDTFSFLIDVFDSIQKQVRVWLDDLFGGGEKYGGDVNNVGSISDSANAVVNSVGNTIHQGIDDITDDIRDAQEFVADCYDMGKDTAVESTSEMVDEAGANVATMASYYESMGKKALKAADDVKTATSSVTRSASAASDVAEDTNKVSDAFKEDYNNLKAKKIYGEIDDAEYYAELEKLLDDYHTYGLSAYNSYYSEISSYNKSQQKEQLSSAKKSIDDLLELYEDGTISKEQYEKEYAKILEDNVELESDLREYEAEKFKKTQEKVDKQALSDAKKSIDKWLELYEDGTISKEQYEKEYAKILEDNVNVESDLREYEAEKFKKTQEKVDKQALSDAKKQIDKLIKLYKNGDITLEQYKEESNKIIQENAEVQSDLKLYEQEKYNDAAAELQKKADAAEIKELKSTQKTELSDLKTHLTTLASTYQKQYDAIVKKQETYASKLKSGLDIFQKEETDDKITYSIANIKEYKQKVDSFTKSVQKLKDKGLNDDLLEEIMGMGVDEGSIYAENLLKMSDSDFDDINDTYDALSDLIDDRSKELYSDELQQVNDDFVSDVKDLFGELPEDIKGIGLESATAFVDGLDLSKDNVISGTKEFCGELFTAVTSGIDTASSASDTADEYSDALVEEIEERAPDVEEAIKKLLDTDVEVAATVKTTVESESTLAPAIVDKSGSTASSSSDVQSGSLAKALEALNKPIYITLDGKTIAESTISYANRTNRITGGSVIK